MKEFTKLLETIKKLRDPEKGCPWDLKQTSKSLVSNFIEELYETVEAIELEDYKSLKEELGDFFFHILMQSQIAEENERFTLEEVIKGINDKLVNRHPHIFGKRKVDSVEEIKDNWEKIKMEEKSERASVLEGIPKKMPALIVAQRMQEKAASVGFDWEDLKPVYAKIKEEVDEFKEALAKDDKHEMEDELGDILFSVVNLSRKAGIDAETALRRSFKKFEERFQKIEEYHKEKGENIYESSLEKLDSLWNLSKKSKRK